MKHANWIFSPELRSIGGKLLKHAVFVGALVVVVAPGAYAQTQQAQVASKSAVSDSVVAASAEADQFADGELVLGEINIEAIIEKPNVDLIPSRKKPKVDEVSFIERSFEAELKEVPKDLMLYDTELDPAKKLSKLIKALNKKKDD